jgi:hypothetical protein
VLLSATVVAVLTGAAATMERVARAREEAMAARIDAMGPPLSVIPPGTRREALERYDLGGTLLAPGTQDAIKAVLGSSLRSVDGLLAWTEDVGGRFMPVVGRSARTLPRDLPPGDVAVAGAELGRRMSAGDVIEVRGHALRVVRVAPPVGTIDDTVLLVPLGVAQRFLGVDATAVNVLRLELRAGVKPAAAREALERGGLGAVVVLHDRGGVADGEVQASLAVHRSALYAAMAIVALFGLLAAAHLDAAERRLELATLVAIGGSRRSILAAVIARSGLTSTIGACVGVAFGIGAAALQDPAAAGAWVRWWTVAATTIAVAAMAGAVASAPVALACASRDPVRDLQGE